MTYKQQRDLAWAVSCHMYEYVGKHPEVWSQAWNDLWRQFYTIGCL